MKKMLQDYGGDIFSIDATGSTNQYGMNLFAVVVLDNQRKVQCGGVMILQNSKSEWIELMLNKLKANTDDWKPKHMISDKDSAQILALGTYELTEV